jgi:hypothetical protein
LPELSGVYGAGVTIRGHRTLLLVRTSLIGSLMRPKRPINVFSTKRPPNNHDFRLSIGLVFLKDKTMAQFSEEGLGHLLQVSR